MNRNLLNFNNKYNNILSIGRLFIFVFFILPKYVVFSQISHDDNVNFALLDKIPNIEGFSDIESDNEGNIFLLNSQSNRICKYLSSSSYDSSYCIGGKGNQGEGFLNITKIAIKNRQSLYVLDFAKRKITLLNTNLKAISNLDFMTLNAEGENEKEVELFPLSFDVNEWGDLFLLNYSDNKVYKYTATGYTGICFGGLDFGEGTLQEPTNLVISENNLVYVDDNNHESINIYDLYGVFQQKIDFSQKKQSNWKNFVLFAEYLLLFNDKNVSLFHLPTNEFIPIKFPILTNEKIVDICISVKHILLLTNLNVYIYEK